MCGAELKNLPEGVQRVAAELQRRGHPHLPQMLDDAARTAQQAADALGILVATDAWTRKRWKPMWAARSAGPMPSL